MEQSIGHTNSYLHDIINLPFSNKQLHRFRSKKKDAKGNMIYAFVGSEVAGILEHSNLTQSIKDSKLEKGVDYFVVSKKQAKDFFNQLTKYRLVSGRSRSITILYESGFWALAMNSETKEGELLRKFLSREVLPSIARSGLYVVSQGKPNLLDLEKYTSTSNQKQLVKDVSTVLYINNNGNPNDIISHHQENCKHHFGLSPSELRDDCVNKGMKVKSKSGREIARIIKPEAASSMAMHDDFVSRGFSINQLAEMKLKEAIEPAFKKLIEMGFTPIQLLKAA